MKENPSEIVIFRYSDENDSDFWKSIGGPGEVSSPNCTYNSWCLDKVKEYIGDMIDFDFDPRVDTPQSMRSRGKNVIVI